MTSHRTKMVPSWRFKTKGTVYKFRAMVVNTGMTSGEWILEEGYWNDSGVWIDGDIWKDS